MTQWAPSGRPPTAGRKYLPELPVHVVDEQDKPSRIRKTLYIRKVRNKTQRLTGESGCRSCPHLPIIVELRLPPGVSAPQPHVAGAGPVAGFTLFVGGTLWWFADDMGLRLPSWSTGPW